MKNFCGAHNFLQPTFLGYTVHGTRRTFGGLPDPNSVQRLWKQFSILFIAIWIGSLRFSDADRSAPEIVAQVNDLVTRSLRC